MRVLFFIMALLCSCAALSDEFCRLEVGGNPKILHSFGTIRLQEISGTYIWFDASAGNLMPADVQGLSSDTFNYNTLYKVTDVNGQSWYFRFSGQWFDSNKTQRTAFYSVEWNNNDFPQLGGDYTIESVLAPRTQTGTVTMATVGDSITWFNKGQRLRCELSKKLPKVKFVGSYTDSYGYGHNGHGGDGSLETLLKIKQVPASDYYLVLIGTNDNDGMAKITIKNIADIIDSLLVKNKTGKIVISTLLPRGDQYDHRASLVNQEIRKWYKRCSCSKRVILLDLDRAMRKEHDIREYISEDHIHPSEKGYEFIGDMVSSTIKKSMKR